jgi:16S rRNA (cytidine1402-2'-O)-methyltransferase
MAKLYLVGTPIGNLKDITLRAIETLNNVDVIACEDTRHSLGLLNYYNIKKQLIACHKFNERDSIEKIAKFLDEDKNVALITDAGMPAISDPGAILVNGLKNMGYSVEVVPGPTAVTSAVALSGILNPVFTFIGFLPPQKRERNALIEQYKNVDTSLVIYSSPYDINKDCEYLFKTLGDREVYVVKELTKIHESSIKYNLKDFKIEDPKGEYVLIVLPGEKVEIKPKGSIKEQLEELLKSGINKKEAIKEVAKRNNLPKDDVYKVAMEI